MCTCVKAAIHLNVDPGMLTNAEFNRRIAILAKVVQAEVEGYIHEIVGFKPEPEEDNKR